MKLKLRDPVCIITGNLKGKLGYYIGPYPYPEGDPINPKYLIEIAERDMMTGAQKVIVGENDFIKIRDSAEDVEHVQNFMDEVTPIEKAKFAVGDRVVITFGDYRGCVADVKEVKPLLAGKIYDYIVGPVQHGNVEVDVCVPEQHLIFWYKHEIPPTVGGFDVTQYLSTLQLNDIATDIYKDAVKAHIDKVLQARTFGNTNLTDYILAQVANYMIQDTADSFTSRIRGRLFDIINGDVSEEVQKYINDNIAMTLTTILNRYMESHTDEVIQPMIDRIKVVAQKQSDEIITKALSRSIDFKEILKKAISEA